MNNALIIVDVQNDFAHPDGSLYVNPGNMIIQDINATIGYALTSDYIIVYTQDWHPEHTPHFNTDGGPWPPHCVQDTWGANFHRDLFQYGDNVFRKGQNGEDGYSGFYMTNPETGETHSTGLDGFLKLNDVTRVVVVGIATDVCVKATALDANALGYETEVDLSLTAAVSEETLEVAIQEMMDAGIVLTGAVPEKVRQWDDNNA